MINPKTPTLQSSEVEYLYTMNLLCEAWELNSGDSVKFHFGFPITAPTKVSDWFGPFGQSPNSTAAAAIARGMVTKDAQSKVESFLNCLVAMRNQELNPFLKTQIPRLKKTLKRTIENVTA